MMAAALASALLLAGPASAAEVSGAGSTFIYPIVAKWADTYKDETGIGVNYQSIGSGGGIKQVTAGTVTFGATDKPLSDEELERLGLAQFPIVMGGIVPFYDLPDLAPGALVLDGETLARIYLGEITRWDDPAIATLNPGLKLPAIGIVVVYRSDGSGTTYNFTRYLSRHSAAWREKVGSDTAVEWPVGIGAKGTEGVAAMVKQLRGAIGYGEYAFAALNHMASARLVNAEGLAVAPSLIAFAAAAGHADWAGSRNFRVSLVDRPGAGSWPLVAASWVLMHTRPDAPARAAEALRFFDWAYRHGDEAARALDYVPLPEEVVGLVEKSWSRITAGGQPVFTPAR